MKRPILPIFSVAFLLAIFPLALSSFAQTAADASGATAAPPVQTSSPGQTGQTSPTAPAAGDAKAAQPDYRIGSDDSLQVTVWKEPTLSGTFPVRPDGMISLVLVGEMKAAGLTPSELSANITERLKKYIQDPLVTVVVAAVNSQKIYLLGEVQKVGQLVLTPGMTPLQAISSAGGLTAYANAKKIYILRNQGGKQVKIPFNYKAAVKGDSRQDVTLLSGDTIFVP